MIAPRPQKDWALFLDLDGTLLDIAPRPEAVVVPPGLVEDLQAARSWLGGALAVVSGRPLEDIDRLLAPLCLDCAAEHGALLRLEGSVFAAGRAVPQAWRQAIREAMAGRAGVLVEEKACSIAVHYRLAPHEAPAVEALLGALVAHDPAFELLPARMAFEIRDAGANKGSAVRAMMQVPPFAGRTPVFIGDDVTDEDGFREAQRRGGFGLHVNDAFDGAPSNVRNWLHEMR